MSLFLINLLLGSSSTFDLELVTILLFHQDLRNELHEDPDFVLIVVLEQVVDLVRLNNSGAGSTGWLEREAAVNAERTSGHLGSRDVRSQKTNCF